MSTIGIVPPNPTPARRKTPEEIALLAAAEAAQKRKQERLMYGLGALEPSELTQRGEIAPSLLEPGAPELPEFTEGMGPTGKETLRAGQIPEQGPRPNWTARKTETLPLPEHIKAMLPEEAVQEQGATAPSLALPMEPEAPQLSMETRRDLLNQIEGTSVAKTAPSTAPEPFQVSAEAEQRMADLEKKKGLIEALQLIGTGAAQIGGRSAAVRAPDMTGEVNTAIAEQKDILPEAERAWLNQKFSLQLPRGITRTALNTMLPTIGRLTGGDKALEQKREMDLLRLQETNRRFGIRTDMTKAQKAVEVGLKFDTSPFVKGQKEAMISADKALAQLAANTSLSEMGALISLARAAGEKGPLSDTDVGRWSQRRGLLPKLEMWAYQQATGKFTEQHRAEMKQILEEMREVAQSGVKIEADRWAKRHSTRPELYGSYDDIMKIIQPEQTSAVGGQETATQSNRVQMKDKDGNLVTVPAHQVEQATKQGYTRA